MRYYLAVDIGTTNWKAAVYDETGKLINIERTPTQTHTDDNGYSYYDPDDMWDAVCKLCRTVTAKTAVVISGVSVTSIAEAVVAIDKNGKAIGKIITWYDTRSMQQAEELKKLFGSEKLYEITGLDVNPIFSLSKILWVRENRSDIYEKSYKWLQMADYILFRLSGEFVTDYTLASRTLALDVRKNEWSKEISNKVNVPVSFFPQICESGTVIGEVSECIANCTGITKGAKIVVGGNDHPCASIAAGVLSGNKILDSSGTAESFIYVSKKNAVPEMKFLGQRTCRYLQKDRYALWGGIISSGRSFDWGYETFTSSKVFGIEQSPYSYNDILKHLFDVKGIESGLIFYPHIRGAGAPYWNPKISGSFLGIRDYHTSKHMLKAVIEGLSMQAKMIVSMEEKVAATTADSLCVVGGSSNNRVWQTIKASVLQKRLELCFEPEATSLGAAMLASIGNGDYKDIEEVSGFLAQKNEIIEPDDQLVKIYAPWYEIYAEGYERLKEFNEKLYDRAHEQKGEI